MMISLLFISLAFVLGVIVGWFGPGLLLKVLPKPKEDRDAGLRRYQAMKNGS